MRIPGFRAHRWSHSSRFLRRALSSARRSLLTLHPPAGVSRPSLLSVCGQRAGVLRFWFCHRGYLQGTSSLSSCYSPVKSGTSLGSNWWHLRPRQGHGVQQALSRLQSPASEAARPRQMVAGVSSLHALCPQSLGLSRGPWPGCHSCPREVASVTPLVITSVDFFLVKFWTCRAMDQRAGFPRPLPSQRQTPVGKDVPWSGPPAQPGLSDVMNPDRAQGQASPAQDHAEA